MFLLVIVSFFLGAAFIILIELLIIYQWFRRTPQSAPELTPPRNPVTNHEDAAKFCAQDGATDSETCMFVNLIFQFLWREWRDTPRARNFFIKKMNLEFQEMLRNKAAGKLMEQITVRDYYLGDSLPLIKKATVMKIDSRNSKQVPRELDVSLEIDYQGGFIISLDIDLIFGKQAYVAVKLASLKGRMRLQFTRNPCTHWSFSFYDDPIIDLHVESQFDGRSLPRLTHFIRNQILQSVKKKHTLPRYKVRYTPFFFQQLPQDGAREAFVHNSLMTVGSLEVQVVNCSRLPELPHGSFIYCKVSIDSVPIKEDMPLRRSLWPVHEIHLERALNGILGVSFTQGYEGNTDDRQEIVVAETITPNSPASQAGIQRGDILLSVNNVDVESMKQAVRLIKNSGPRIYFRLQRPPPDHLLDPTNLERSCEEPLPESAEFRVDESFDFNSVTVEDDDSETEEFVNIVVQEMVKEIQDDDQAARKLLENVRKKSKHLLHNNGSKTSNSDKMKAHKVLGIEQDVNIEEGVGSDTNHILDHPLLSSENKDGDQKSKKRSRTFASYFTKQKRSPPVSPKLPVKRNSKVTISEPDVKDNASPKVRRRSSSTMSGNVRKRSIRREKSKTLDDTGIKEEDINDDFDGQSISRSLFVSDFDEDDEVATQYSGFSSISKSENQSSGTDGEGWDNISQNIELESDEEAAEGSDSVGKKTAVIYASREPSWNETFTFDVEKEHRYLNISVLNRTGYRYGQDVLRGFVSIPLMEMAFQSMSTSSKKSYETYVLSASENQYVVNRAYIRTLMPGMNPALCFGDITLAYKYIPSTPEYDLDDEEKKVIAESLLAEKEDLEKDAISLAAKQEEDKKEHSHTFMGTQFYFPTRCDYCQRKVWTKTAFQCRVCAMICHKKCLKNAQTYTYCTSQGVRAKPHQWQGTGKDPMENEEPVHETSSVETNICPSALSSDVSDGNIPEKTMYNVKVPDVTDLRPGMKECPSPMRQRRILDPPVTDSSTEMEVQPESSKEVHMEKDSIATAAATAKEAGRELYASLEKSERKHTIESMVQRLQQQIDDESRNQGSLRRHQELVEDPEKLEKITCSLRKSEERGQALSLLMIQYCAALQECFGEGSETEQSPVL